MKIIKESITSIPPVRVKVKMPVWVREKVRV
jgi:hypothetical protein